MTFTDPLAKQASLISGHRSVFYVLLVFIPNVFLKFIHNKLNSSLSGYREIGISRYKTVNCQKEVIFVTATDGNHGRGVAWASKLFGCKAYVYMPTGSVEARRKAIEDAGAEKAVISDLNYDKVVQYASRQTKEKGWTLIQDTSWEGRQKK